MTRRSYYYPTGGLPPQTQLLTDRAVMTEAYTIIPKGTFSDIVASWLPFWDNTRFWIIARPLSGFAETFTQYIAEIMPGGGSDLPDTEAGIESAIFVVGGEIELTIAGTPHRMTEGGFAYIPANTEWSLHNRGVQTGRFHWIRKRYDALDGMPCPDPLVTSDAEVPPSPMPDCDGVWATTRFVDPTDMRHDMHVTVVTLQPGAVIPFPETHVMEHGLYVLEGKGVYRLNQDWVEVEAGDYMWLRAFCPQACYAGGPGPFRYLLYKDVHRHPRLDRY